MKKKQITIPIFIPHEGCPHRCHFCNQWETSGSYSVPDGSFVKKTISNYLETSHSIKHREVAFFGGSFTGLDEDFQRELLKPAMKFKKDGSIHGIRLSTRPDYIDEKRLNLLEEYGVTTIELGVQSFFNDVLEASNRGHSSEDVFRASELIKTHGFNLVIQLMPGLPFDTIEKSIQSANITSRIKPTAVRIYPTVVLKKTYLEKMYNEKRFSPLTIEEAIQTCKEMYLIFIKNSIDVIRLGLHPFSEDEIKNIVAGAYHPAFGFLVKARIKRDIMDNELKFFQKNRSDFQGKSINMIIPDKSKEEYIGMKKENIIFLQDKFQVEIKYSFENTISEVTFCL